MDLVNIIGLVVVIIQLYLAYKIFKADHERKKKQSTIEYLDVRKQWLEHKYHIDSALGFERLCSQDIEQIKINEEMQALIKALLGLLEHVSVGINTKVYDKEILYRMSGTFLINLFERFELVIQDAQKENQYSYIEFEDLISDFKDRKRKKPDPRGNIRFS